MRTDKHWLKSYDNGCVRGMNKALKVGVVSESDKETRLIAAANLRTTVVERVLAQRWERKEADAASGPGKRSAARCTRRRLEPAGDLRDNLDHADAVAESIKTTIDKFIAERGSDAPTEAGDIPVWEPAATPSDGETRAPKASSRAVRGLRGRV